MVGSPLAGSFTCPADAPFVASRATLPPAQRNPSPKTTPNPPLTCASPWKKSTDVVAGNRNAFSVTLSAERLAVPVASSRPPLTPFTELRQPSLLGGGLPLLHGHAVPLLSPVQNGSPTRVPQASENRRSHMPWYGL